MQSLRRRSLIVFCSVLMLGLWTSCQQPQAVASGGTPTTVYDRVTKAGVIRCGYIPYPPGSFKNPNTGKLSGVFVETLEEAGRRLGLKVEWKEEVGWASMIEGLQTDRYDLIGTPVWENAARGRQADFTIPLYYSGIGVFVRTNDNRFLKKDGALDVNAINSKNVRLSTSDGDVAQVIARTDFPNAQEVAVSQMADRAQMLLNVSEGKADIAFNEPQTAYEFGEKNPGKLKNIASQKPIRIFPNVMMFKHGQYELKDMLDAALEELITSGYVDKLIDRYEPFKGATYRLAFPYRQFLQEKSPK